jgi:hypothetical protein
VKPSIIRKRLWAAKFLVCYLASLATFLFFPNSTQAAHAIPAENLADHLLNQCALFAPGSQDQSLGQESSVVLPAHLRLKSYSPIFRSCRRFLADKEMIAIRSFLTSEPLLGETAYLLLVDPKSLSTQIENQNCYWCESANPEAIKETPYGALLENLSTDSPLSKNKKFYVAAGLRKATFFESGAVVSADLCPSSKPLDKKFIESLERLQSPLPITLAVSGFWLEKHKKELEWLQSEARSGRLKITWANHSLHHEVLKKVPDEHNFLLIPGTDMNEEVLETEKLMIENGITPSVFFRFPGLVSDQRTMFYLKEQALLPLSSDSWLSLGQMPHDQSIILVHANGNEPGGLRRFRKLLEEKKIPLPVQPLIPWSSRVKDH